ncbi:Uncharacterized protein APZ42_029550 [Daphnia magna]|uniref:Uncharacterized protein n=1 Tax=Daphnia magna TaxID=35525 RepID=A0A164PNY6_9CRUS|nr:Uncharacterized protein APZ42_029550 [Daphnia magna]
MSTVCCSTKAIVGKYTDLFSQQTHGNRVILLLASDSSDTSKGKQNDRSSKLAIFCVIRVLWMGFYLCIDRFAWKKKSKKDVVLPYRTVFDA